MGIEFDEAKPGAALGCAPPGSPLRVPVRGPEGIPCRWTSWPSASSGRPRSVSLPPLEECSRRFRLSGFPVRRSPNHGVDTPTTRRRRSVTVEWIPVPKKGYEEGMPDRVLDLYMCMSTTCHILEIVVDNRRLRSLHGSLGWLAPSPLLPGVPTDMLNRHQRCCSRPPQLRPGDWRHQR